MNVLDLFNKLEKVAFECDDATHREVTIRKATNGHLLRQILISDSPDRGRAYIVCDTCGRTIEYSVWGPHTHDTDVCEELVASHLR